jgi:hypothetical protein
MAPVEPESLPWLPRPYLKNPSFSNFLRARRSTKSSNLLDFSFVSLPGSSSIVWIPAAVGKGRVASTWMLRVMAYSTLRARLL